jgi:hypothetical protein
MKKFGDFWQVLKNRWRNHMPKFFARMMWICSLISGTALAANEAMELANIEPHQWWIDIRAYLIAVPAGAAFACKFTQEYDKNGQPIQKGLEPQEPKAVNNCDVVAEHPDEV